MFPADELDVIGHAGRGGMTWEDYVMVDLIKKVQLQMHRQGVHCHKQCTLRVKQTLIGNFIGLLSQHPKIYSDQFTLGRHMPGRCNLAQEGRCNLRQRRAM